MLYVTENSVDDSYDKIAMLFVDDSVPIAIQLYIIF